MRQKGDRAEGEHLMYAIKEGRKSALSFWGRGGGGWVRAEGGLSEGARGEGRWGQSCSSAAGGEQRRSRAG